jgi:predicted Zn-dependent protease
MKRALMSAMVAVATVGCAVSTQQEVQLGQDYASQINAQLPIVQDAEINRYINVLGDSIARLSDDRSLDWHFYVVNSKEVNAFAVPGGFIYVNRGLIERAANLSQLAGVMGHEIAHVTERHSIEAMQKSQTANVGVTLVCVLLNTCGDPVSQTAINVAGGAYFARHSRQAETESDQQAVRYVMRAGIHPKGIPEMFRTLLDERQRRPEGVEAWFATHPLEEDRIQHTQSLIDAIDDAILLTLTVDTPNFQTFKRRVASLPAAG